MRVDFVIGGTQKGGTSALDSFLRQHPDICMPDTKKELHFFDREADDTDYKKYHANFRPKPEHRVIGEASPIYMYWETAPHRIWKYNSKMKWILALRNPVDRAFYAHQVRRLFNIFGRDNCLVLLNEELRNDHEKTLRRVFEFLGVDDSFVPPEASVFEQEYSIQIDDELRSRLIDTFYFDIKELEKLLQRDLSAWYRKTL